MPQVNKRSRSDIAQHVYFVAIFTKNLIVKDQVYSSSIARATADSTPKQ